MTISLPIDVVLRDGSTAQVRPITPADATRLGRFYAGLSPESSYSRFFRVMRDAATEVERLTAADGEHTVALACEAASTIVAVASYTRDTQKVTRAEVAFATADPLQGHGIGTRLLEILADLARERGVTIFDAYVLATNHSMMQVFLDSGFAAEQRLDAGVYRVALTLAATPASDARSAARSEAAAAASLHSFFQPGTVAVIGANRERGKIGSEVLHNLSAGGFRGRLFAVHPTASSIDGVPACRRVIDIDGDVDLAVIAVPAQAVPAVVDDCLAKHVRALVIISAGFAETGAPGRAVEMEIVEKIRRAGVRLIGPNCMGILNTNPAVRLNATFSPSDPPAGRVAMSTQSGALGLAILDYARRLNIGLSTFVSVGNKADVSSNDLIQYWANDPLTEVIVLYLESFGNPRKFAEIARRVGRLKPIVAVKSGRSSAGARAASSHTGALASRDLIVDALFRQAGVIRTNTLEELFDVATLVAHQPIPPGRKVAILTNAGGPGILAADACEAQGLELTSLSDATIAALRALLPAAAATGNPVDMLASASPEHYERALEILLADDHVQSVIVIFIPPLVTKIEDAAQAVKRAAAGFPRKPVLGVFMSADSATPLLDPVPCFAFPEAAVVALARVAAYGAWRRTPPGTVPVFTDIDEVRVRAIVTGALSRGGGWLTATENQALLTAAHIPVAFAEAVTCEEDAVASAARIGFPVVLKASGPLILHKTEVGGIIVNLQDAEAVRHAWRTLATRVGSAMTGALVQQMIVGGAEMLIGAVEDPTFGPVIACGTGGTLAELLADVQFRLHPLTEQDATALVNGLRGAALLRGYRRAPRLDEAGLVGALLRFSALVTLCPEIQEADLNPVVVLAEGVRALDVRIRVERPRPKPPSRRIVY